MSNYYKKRMKELGLLEEESSNSSSSKSSKTSQKVSSTPKQKSSNYYSKRMKELGIEKDNDVVDKSYINKFLSDADKYLKSTQSNYEGMDYSNSKSVYESNRKTADDLSKRSSAISDYLKKNKDSFGPEEYDSIMSYIDEFGKASASNRYAFYNKGKFYSQFETEDDYKTWAQEQEWAKEYAGMSYDEIKDKIGIVDDKDLRNWLTEYAPSTMKADDYDREISSIDDEIGALESVLSQYDEMTKVPSKGQYYESWMRDFGRNYGSRGDVVAKIEALKASKWEYENKKKYS